MTESPVSEQTAPASGGGHIWYFDVLRVFAMTGVVFMHLSSSILRREISLAWHMDNLLVSLFFCAVPLFFMMSGALLLSSEKSCDAAYLWRRRMPRLLVPLAFWSLATLVWLAVRDDKTPAQLWQELVKGLSDPVYVHFWYIYTLAALYALSPLLYRMVHALDHSGTRYLLLLMGGVLLLGIIRAALPAEGKQYLSWDLANKLNYLNGYLFPFLLGYWLANLKRRIPNLALLLTALGVLLLIAGEAWLRTRQAGEYASSFNAQNGGCELLLAACLFLLAKQNLSRPRRLLKLQQPVAFSMAIYLMHGGMISFLWWCGLAPTRMLSLFWLCPMVLALCFLLAKTLATIPGLCYLSTGQRFRDACESCNWICTWKNLRKRVSKQK